MGSSAFSASVSRRRYFQSAKGVHYYKNLLRGNPQLKSRRYVSPQDTSGKASPLPPHRIPEAANAQSIFPRRP